jgi:hypothetical protein
MKFKYWILEKEINGTKCYFSPNLGGKFVNWVSEPSFARLERTKEDMEWFIHLIKEFECVDDILTKEVEITIL